MILSILIATLPERSKHFENIKSILEKQISENNFDAEIIYDDRGSAVTVGQKRNDLILKSNGDYFCFVDDDDSVSKFYIEKIKDALKHNPDVVTFNGVMTTNDTDLIEWEIKLDEKYEERFVNGIRKYFRFPNHLCVFKKKLVKHFLFPNISHGEDYHWAKDIHVSKVLKNEIHIEEKLYWYDYQTNKNKLQNGVYSKVF